VSIDTAANDEARANLRRADARNGATSSASHVTYEGQGPSVLKPGNYAYGPPKAVHRGRCVSDDACVLFIAFEGPVDATPVGAPAR
jgi:hypothetical protein